MSIYRGLYAAIAYTILVLPMATTAPASPDVGPATPELATAKRVIAIEPRVVVEWIATGSRTGDIDPRAYEVALTRAATDELKARTYALVTSDSIQDPDVSADLKALQPLASRLARGAINDDAKKYLDRLAEHAVDELVLAEFVKLTIGPSGYWDPYSGAIGSPMSSTAVQVALVSPRTGQVIWKNEALVRHYYRADDPAFVQMLSKIFNTFDVSRG